MQRTPNEEQLSIDKLLSRLNELTRVAKTDWRDPLLLLSLFSFFYLIVYFIVLCVAHALHGRLTQQAVMPYLLFTLWTLACFLGWMLKETVRDIRMIAREGRQSFADVLLKGNMRFIADIEPVPPSEKVMIHKYVAHQIDVIKSISKFCSMIAGYHFLLLQVFVSDSAVKSDIVRHFHLVRLTSLCLSVCMITVVGCFYKLVRYKRLEWVLNVAIQKEGGLSTV